MICLMIISGCQQGVPEQKSPGHVSEYYFYGYSYDEIGNVLEDKGLLTEEMDDFLKSIDEKTYNDLIEDKVDFEQVMNDLNKDNPKWSVPGWFCRCAGFTGAGSCKLCCGFGHGGIGCGGKF